MPTSFFSTRPWYHPMALLRRLLNYYLLVFVALCLFQNFLIYPRWQSGAVLKEADAIKQAADSGLVPWYLPGTTELKGYTLRNFAMPAPRGTVVLFHGNGGWALYRAQYITALNARGFRIFLYEYPGYGGRSGRPSEATIVPDARNVIRALEKSGSGPIYIWGESLGAGVAASVCADETMPVHGLVLLTPWDTLAHTAALHFPFIPVGMLLEDKYDSVANLATFRHPVCEVRCTGDKLIYPSINLNLYQHLHEPKKMVVLENCGHDDWPYGPDLKWWDDALNFIAP